MMRLVQPDFDDICDLRERWEATLSPADYRARLFAQVDEMAVGAPGRAELLSCLSTQPGVPVTEESLALARAALEDGGPTTIDSRVKVLRALIELGRDDEAEPLTRELLRARDREGVTVGLHAALGEVLEMAERFRDAHRAYTIGLKEFDPEVDDPTLDEDLCLAGRYRTRRGLDLGFDLLDRCLEELSPQAATAIKERLALRRE
jgi:hypothetical protein